MITNKVLSGTIIGTSIMTLFSYYLSGKLNNQFKEPVLLNKLLRATYLFKNSGKNSPTGWVLHYFIGAVFTIGSHLFWKTARIKPSLQSGALLGLMYGVTGIAGWHLIFKLHPNPPMIDLQEYYLHLLAAHVLFGCGTVIGYRYSCLYEFNS